MNNEGPELSPEARRIISEARGFDEPTSEDRERVKTRWLASVAAIAGVSSLTEAARAAGGVGWGIKAVGAGLSLLAGAIGLYVALPSGEPSRAHSGASDVQPSDTRRADSARAPAWSGETHERFEKTHSGARDVLVAPAASSGSAVPALIPASPGQPVAAAPLEVIPTVAPALAPPELVQPEVGTPSTPVASVDGANAIVPSAPSALEPAPVAAVPRREHPTPARAVAAAARTTRTAAPKAAHIEKAAEESAPSVPAEVPAAGASPSGQLSEELALLSQVRGSVQSGAANQALELLANYETRFGRPILGMEADALRVDALCRAGQRDAARASARAFQNEWPGSPLGPRVNAACP